MRAARLLQMLLLLQNRGRLTSAALAEALEVSPRTILRDVDAMTEAGLPVVVFQGNQGGIELAFDHRTTMTALTTDEAEALALMLAEPHPGLESLGLAQAARRAASKIIERQQAPVRATMAAAVARFSLSAASPGAEDPRLAALALAVREGRIVQVQARSGAPRILHPVRLTLESDWVLYCAKIGVVGRDDWGDVLISARRF